MRGRPKLQLLRPSLQPCATCRPEHFFLEASLATFGAATGLFNNSKCRSTRVWTGRTRAGSATWPGPLGPHPQVCGCRVLVLRVEDPRRSHLPAAGIRRFGTLGPARGELSSACFGENGQLGSWHSVTVCHDENLCKTDVGVKTSRVVPVQRHLGLRAAHMHTARPLRDDGLEQRGMISWPRPMLQIFERAGINSCSTWCGGACAAGRAAVNGGCTLQ